MPRADSAATYDEDELLLEWQSPGARTASNSAISGVLIAVGSSLILWAGLVQFARWAGLVQVARWAAHAIF